MYLFAYNANVPQVINVLWMLKELRLTLDYVKIQNIQYFWVSIASYKLLLLKLISNDVDEEYITIQVIIIIGTIQALV